MPETPAPITLYNAATGETQTVESVEGYDPADWIEVVAKPGLALDERFDGTNWVAIIPPRPPISALDFIGLFTFEEQLAAYASEDAAVKLTIGQTQAAGIIHLDDPRVADGLDLLVAVGIITAERAIEIADGIPPPSGQEVAH